MKKIIITAVLALSAMNANAYNPIRGAGAVSMEWLCHNHAAVMMDARSLMRQGSDYSSAYQLAVRTWDIEMNANRDTYGNYNEFIQMMHEIVADSERASAELISLDLHNYELDDSIRREYVQICKVLWNSTLEPWLIDSIIDLQTN